jgi:hypothetical protein
MRAMAIRGVALLWIVSLWVPPVVPLSTAADKGEIFLGPLFGQIGVRPDQMPAVITGTVVDPEKLSGLGIRDAVAGDGIELIDEGNGKLKVRHIPTGKEVQVRVK